MALTLQESNISVNETFNEMLEDLQGNILKHHGRNVAFHIFVRFSPSHISEAKNWMKDFAANGIVSAKKQLLDAQSRKFDSNYDGGSFYNLSLSAKAYKKMAIPAGKIPKDQKFIGGMQASASRLSDDLSTWEEELRNSIDALIIVADSNEQTAESQKKRIVNELKSFSEMVHVQKGQVLRNQQNLGIEHFGYVDGVSQPLFLKEETDNQSDNGVWQDTAPLKLALVKDHGGAYKDSFGSYFVFRKLDQNVLSFKTMEKKISKTFNGGGGIKDRNGIPNDELAGAMMVGRFEDGSEVVLNSTERHIIHESALNNDFDYRSDKEALKCPFHAHIRMTNPRADIGQDSAKSIRLVRRGIPYNDIGRDTNDLDNDQPEKGVGLLFMCYQSNIAEQFERVQADFSNNGNIQSGKAEKTGRRRPRTGIDAIIGQGNNNSEKTLPSQWGNATEIKTVKGFNGFVTNKGGEYFFTPSISFLKSL